MNSSASDSTLLPSFDPSHIQQVCRGGPLTKASRTANGFGCGYSTGLPVMAHGRFLRPTSFRPSQVLSYRADKTDASSSCCIAGGTSASPPARSAQAGFGGPRTPRRLPYSHQPSSLPCLPPPMRWYALSVQSLASVLDEPAGPDASPPSYSPTPHELRCRATLRATTIQSLSGGLRPFGTPQACRSRHGFSPLELPPPVRACTRYRYERQPRFPTPQRCSPAASMPSSPNPGQAGHGNGVVRRELQSPFPNRGRCRRLRVRYDHRRPVACRASTIKCTRLPQSSSG